MRGGQLRRGGFWGDGGISSALYCSDCVELGFNKGWTSLKYRLRISCVTRFCCRVIAVLEPCSCIILLRCLAPTHFFVWAKNSIIHPLNLTCTPPPRLQHDQPHPTSPLLIDMVPLVDPALDVLCPPVEEVVVQLSVAGAEFLLLEEERVVKERKRVEDIEVELYVC